MHSRFLDCAIQNAELARFQKKISEKREFAKKGLTCSQNCLQKTVEKYRDPRGDSEEVLFSPLGEKTPDRGRTTMGDIFQQSLKREKNYVACLYYEAINYGLILETKAEQYKTGIQKLIRDFQRVSEIDPRYDSAGAFRALAFLYLKMPALPIFGGGLHRDLEKALSYADQALELFPDYFENLKLKGEILLLRKNYASALRYLTKALKNGGREDELSPLIQKAKRKGKN